MPLRSVQRRLR
jgi:hypothetical protein